MGVGRVGVVGLGLGVRARLGLGLGLLSGWVGLGWVVFSSFFLYLCGGWAGWGGWVGVGGKS